MNAEIYEALCEHLISAQLFTPALRVAFPLVLFEAEEEETYLVASWLPNAPVTSVEGNSIFYSGIFQVSLVFPQNARGLVLPLTWAELLTKQFAAGTTLFTNPSAHRIKIPGTPTVSPLVPDSVRPMVPVSIRYEATI